MMNLVKEFLSRKIFAVVGASRDSGKFGNKIFRFLLEHGYEVYPVNPNADEIEGQKCYPDLKSLPKKPDVVDIVVPPKVTEKTVRECRDLGVRRVWMQPGSESEEAIRFCKENNIKVVHNLCVMIEKRKE